MCRVLSVSSSGFYKWLKEEQSPKDSFDEKLIDLIRILHAESFGAYGVRRIKRGLKHQGILVNIKRIRRLMRSIGLSGKGEPKRKRTVTTDSNHINQVAENHLSRHFTVSEPNTHWVSDITYILTTKGWIYLAVVIDLFSRMVVGFAVSEKIDSALISLALEKAYIKRNPKPGLILHSDRGVQYTSKAYRALISKYGMMQSMSRLGNCWDNAVSESFFRSLKVEAIYGIKISSKSVSENLIFRYIEQFYNKTRFHSFLLYKSPVQWELEASMNPEIINFRNSKLLAKKNVHF